jgi:hypothetical protein
MSTINHRMRLPGGAIAVRVDDELAGRRYHVHGTPAVLTALDVEVLFADSIASDGGLGRGGAYTRQHLRDALTWIDQQHGSLVAEIVARALAATGGE